jgi:hypothetical protein
MSDGMMRRLLGHGPADLGCEECIRRLEVWAERVAAGHASHVAEPVVDAHIQGCPDCAEDATGLLSLLS